MFHRKVEGVDYTFIRERYQDTALVIFKKQQQELKEKSGKRASRKRSIKLLGRASTNRGEQSVIDDSAETEREKGVSAVLGGVKEDTFKDDDESGTAVPKEGEDDGLGSRRLGVQSKVCSVL